MTCYSIDWASKSQETKRLSENPVTLSSAVKVNLACRLMFFFSWWISETVAYPSGDDAYAYVPCYSHPDPPMRLIDEMALIHGPYAFRRTFSLPGKRSKGSDHDGGLE